MQKIANQGFSLFEVVIVVGILVVITALAVGFLSYSRGGQHRVDATIERINERISFARNEAITGQKDENRRTFVVASVVLSNTVQFGGNEYANDLPLPAPLITNPTIIFEPQSGRTRDRVFGFIVLKSAVEKEERAIFVPWIPGPNLIYVRRGGSRQWEQFNQGTY
jgi:prepilin-type N-terminal cleavage/methylation domain-containing protein